jgi:hypothetical protein
MVSSSADAGAVAVALFDPSGTRHLPRTRVLGGPPYTYWAEQPSPREGTWTAVLGDGERILACEQIEVRGHRGGLRRHEADVDPAWQTPSGAGTRTPRTCTPRSWSSSSRPRWRASARRHRRSPPGRTSASWCVTPPATCCTTTSVRMRTTASALRPDCADLPYFLRAYFAWKLRLPFAFRACGRGADGQPPACDVTPQHNQQAVPGTDEVNAFQEFSRVVAGTVHSASARTHPDSNATDVYPVPLTRESLLPGTVFADPYGHLLIIARWVPQTATDYGVLIGADAQPDGTVALRRFWRGSFLFSPDTTAAGAGFKAFRPCGRAARACSCGATTRSRRPRAPGRASNTRAAPTTSTTAWRRSSTRARSSPWASCACWWTRSTSRPSAAWCRWTTASSTCAATPAPAWRCPRATPCSRPSGDWEDFATPSRDMRLLISIDAVMGFPDSVLRQPARFGVSASEARAVAARLRQELDTLLAARAITYVRSDGAQQRVTLAELVARKAAFEVAYNPNDCVETRWGAPAGSAEAQSCQRRAPPEQVQRMARYREWFARRQRPAR